MALLIGHKNLHAYKLTLFREAIRDQTYEQSTELSLWSHFKRQVKNIKFISHKLSDGSVTELHKLQSTPNYIWVKTECKAANLSFAAHEF